MRNFFLTHLYTHNSTQSALVAVSNAVRRQLLSKQTNNMDNSDEPEDFLESLCSKKPKMEHSIKPKWYVHSAGRRYRFTVENALVGEGSSSGMRQTTLTEQRRPLTKSACDKC